MSKKIKHPSKTKNKKSTICAVSIVKDEEHVIERMLNNLNKYVDEFVIVDTGSTDKTISLIKKFFKEKNVKGKVYQRPWKNFGHNKTEAFQIAEKTSFCDYLLFMDADNTIEGVPVFPEELTDDLYLLKQSYDENNFFWRGQLFKKGLGWRYEGVLHEYPACENIKSTGYIEGKYYCRETHQGSRNRDLTEKYERDVATLKKGLEAEPKNSRYMYYLGQSYLCLNKLEESAKWYIECSYYTGWIEEGFHGLYCAGKNYLSLGNIKEAKKWLIRAWRYHPKRVDSLYVLMEHHFSKNDLAEAYLIGKLIVDVEVDHRVMLFPEQDIYDWKRYDVMSIVCYYLGLFDEGKEYFHRMKNVPESHMPRIKENAKYFQ